VSLEHLKKQAKALRKLLPDFVREHSANPTLSACQELIARSNGFPSWHAAVTAAVSEPPIDAFDAAHQKLLSSLVPHISWQQVRGDAMSDDALRQGIVSVRLECADPALLYNLSDVLNDFLERHDIGAPGRSGHADGDVRELEDLCRRQVASAPWFIDGHAHLVHALTCMGRHKDAFAHGRPILNAVVAMLPNGENFSGRIPWYEVSNRPVLRLAYFVASAYFANRVEGQGYRLRAQELVDQFLNWWPEDNVGMRYLLKPRPQAA